MRQLWTDDIQTIIKEIDALIEGRAEIICGRRGPKELKKLALKAKSKTPIGDLLVLHHPHEPSCSSDKCLFYYRFNGSPLRCFESERVKKVKDLMGLKYPTQIFNIHHRQYPRVKTAGNSTAVFSLLNKQRLFSGKVEDISLEGAKLLVDIPVRIAVHDTLCHITRTLCSRFSTIDEIKVHIPEATVVWLKGNDDVTHTIGVKFSWHEKTQEFLSTYIDLRSIEDPEGSAA